MLFSDVYMFFSSVSVLAAFLGATAAIFSGITAFRSYRLSQKIRDELKSDERIVAGTPTHPDLREPSHSAGVLQCTLFNKSKRKAFVNAVAVYDKRKTTMDIKWSDSIDHLGNPQNPCQLIGIVDASSLFIRRNDGKEIDYARVMIFHSWSDTPMEIIFDPKAEWESK